MDKHNERIKQLDIKRDTETKYDSQIEKRVFDELVQRGYPKESILSGMEIYRKRSIGSRQDGNAIRTVDFVINDVSTGLPVMMIEVKNDSGTHISAQNRAYDNLKDMLSDNWLPVKAVAAIVDGSGRITFTDFTEAIQYNDFSRAVKNYIIPPYDVLTSGSKQKAIVNQKNEQKKKIIVLKWLCWGVLPLLSIALIILDAFSLYELSSLRLITIGVGAGVTLIPCFKEISIGEVTLKNIIEQRKEESE